MDTPTPFVNARLLHYSKGSVIVAPGIDIPQKAFLIVAGSVRQCDTQVNGSEITLNVYHPGSVLALTWTVAQQPNKYYFIAENDVTIRSIPAQEYRDYLQNNPEASYQLLHNLARGFDGIFSRLATGVTNDAESRILNEVAIEFQRNPQGDAEGKYITLEIQNLARRSGLARETVSRTITKLCAKNVIERTGNKIRYRT
jgi:CRP/FNR family transcriptional regulator, cyclic AMP receptor protein